ncbi:MAG: cellulase family glycosylhydrolase [Clostridia bacterium]|nr:cellulase family glycosylhydrolase [Clostridia bacterium]
MFKTITGRRKLSLLPIFFVIFTLLWTMSACGNPSKASTASENASESTSVKFSDVADGAWYYEAVSDMCQKGLLKGYNDGSFRPGSTITRGEFITIAARILGIEVGNSSGYWATGNIEAVRDKANCWVIWNLPDYKGNITREEAASVIILSLLPEAGQGDWNAVTGSIKDFGSITSNYQALVERAYANNILTGYEDGSFRPKGNLTRAEAATILFKCFKMGDFQNAGAAEEPVAAEEYTPVTPAVSRSGGVKQNGTLKVTGTQLCNKNGDPVVLHGMSSHGIQWFPDFISNDAVKFTADSGANIFRIAMYVEENGYMSDKAAIKSRVFSAVNAAVAQDMYVIIDWHILNGVTADPMNYKSQAIEFFDEVSAKYKSTPNVIYEICNEPNGNISWAGNIKPYAEAVIPVIRKNSPDSVIIVGTPTWSQDVDVAAKDPLSYKNIMYAFHFYAGTHGQNLRDKVDTALKLGAPVFVSEWGTSDASGNGGPYIDKAKEWMSFMNARSLSWCNWSLCDKNEASASLISGAYSDKKLTGGDLSTSGKYVFENF